MDILPIIDGFKATLPAQIQEYWWTVILILALFLLLIIVNFPKLFKKRSSLRVEEFKQQNLPKIIPGSMNVLQAKRIPQIPSGNMNSYIQSQLDAGVDESIITKNLVSLGWDRSVVEMAFAKRRRP